MKFEIINPSDPYMMTAPDLQIAAVAVCLLGDGKYPLSGIDEDEGNDVPAFLFGGHDEWFTEKFGSNFHETAERTITGRNDDLVSALESVQLQRGTRTSMNDIARRAKNLAIAVREKAKGERQ